MIRSRYVFPLRLLPGSALPYDFHGVLLGWGRCRDLAIRQRPPAILDADAAVSPFAHHHLALCRRVLTARQLKKAEYLWNLRDFSRGAMQLQWHMHGHH